jgi:hypothetical protein
MATMNTTFTSTKQKVAAERIAGFGAEQRRLKEAAAVRRAAAAARGDDADKGFSPNPERPPVAARRSQYLR